MYPTLSHLTANNFNLWMSIDSFGSFEQMPLPIIYWWPFKNCLNVMELLAVSRWWASYIFLDEMYRKRTAVVVN